MIIPITHSIEQAKALVMEGGASLDDFIDWQRAVEAASIALTVSQKGCISVPIGRRWGMAMYVVEHERYKAATPHIDAFIASDPLQYHAAGKDEEGKMFAARVVRLSKGKNDKVVIYAAEEADEWKRLNGEGPIPSAKARKPGERVVERGEVTAKTLQTVPA